MVATMVHTLKRLAPDEQQPSVALILICCSGSCEITLEKQNELVTRLIRTHTHTIRRGIVCLLCKVFVH